MILPHIFYVHQLEFLHLNGIQKKNIFHFIIFLENKLIPSKLLILFTTYCNNYSSFKLLMDHCSFTDFVSHCGNEQRISPSSLVLSTVLNVGLDYFMQNVGRFSSI